MEDVLEVYKRPYDPRRPVVCLDETSKQLIGEVQTPVDAAPGHVARYDYEYVRNGVANLFMIFEPLAGQRDVEVTDRRTKKDYAECLTADDLRRKVTAWEAARDAGHTKVNWQFTTADARIKLRRLYPSIDD